MSITFAIVMTETRQETLVTKDGREYPPATSLSFLQNHKILGCSVWASDRDGAAQFSTRAVAEKRGKALGPGNWRVMRIAVAKLAE